MSIYSVCLSSNSFCRDIFEKNEKSRNKIQVQCPRHGHPGMQAYMVRFSSFKILSLFQVFSLSRLLFDFFELRFLIRNVF